VSRFAGLVLASLLFLPACGGKKGLTPEELEAKIASKLEQADSQVPNNRLKNARESYNWVLSERPGHWQAYRGLGMIGIEEKDWATAEEQLKKAAAAKADDSETHAALGIVYVNNEKWGDAAASFAKAYELDSNDASYGLRWGANLRKAGDAAQAEEILRKVSDSDPEEKYVWTELGDALRDQNKDEEALKIYMKAQKTYASDKGARVGAAAVYEKRGEWTEAINELSEYVRMDCCTHYSDNVIKPKLDELRAKEQEALSAPATDGG
jgi:tetratricopeptide (TPR) repeat protein